MHNRKKKTPALSSMVGAIHQPQPEQLTAKEALPKNKWTSYHFIFSKLYFISLYFI